MRTFAAFVAGGLSCALFKKQELAHCAVDQKQSSSLFIPRSSSEPSHVPVLQASTPYSLSPSFCEKEFREYEYISGYDESHNTRVLRFSLPNADQRCNFTCASCILAKIEDKKDSSKTVIRPYTPISRIDQMGYFEIIVKKYKNSKMGTHMHSLTRGNKMQFRGPIMKIPVKPNQFNTIGMIVGGTGIAPAYQIIRELIPHPDNRTKINLIYANRRKEDVLLANELNELMLKYENFSPYYVLSDPPSNWMGGVGYVNKWMVKSFMPSPMSLANTRSGDTNSNNIIMVCGPPGFMNHVCGDKDYTVTPPTQGELKGLLEESGYSPKMVFKF